MKKINVLLLAFLLLSFWANAQQYPFNGLDMNMGNLSRLSNAQSRSCTGRIHRCVCLRQPVSAAQTGILCFQRAQSAHLLGANVGEKSCHRHQLRLGRPGHPADAVHLAAKRGARHLFPAGLRLHRFGAVFQR